MKDILNFEFVSVNQILIEYVPHTDFCRANGCLRRTNYRAHLTLNFGNFSESYDWWLCEKHIKGIKRYNSTTKKMLDTTIELEKIK